MYQQKALSTEVIRKIAPSVFATEAHDSRSQRYTYIPTSDVLAGLQGEGFEVFSATQSRARDESRREHTKHMIRLRHRSTEGAQVGDSIPEIVLINSHDGTSAYKMIAGVYRLVCSNGLVVGQSFQSITIPHKGDVRGRVIEGAFEVLSQTQTALETAQGMNRLQLTTGERLAFGRAAAALRWDGGAEAAPVQAEQIVRPRRSADAGASLWQTFNTAQENLVRGGLHGVRRNEQGRIVGRARTRAVSGIDQNTNLNRALWTLAEEMAKLKAA